MEFYGLKHAQPTTAHLAETAALNIYPILKNSL